MSTFDDGTGAGFKAKVDGNNRLHVQAVQVTEVQRATEVGDAYNINTGDISYATSGSMLYFKNNEDQDFILQSIAVGVGTGSVSEIGTVTIVRNPTGGDIITDATAPAMNQNRNFGSSKTLEDSLVYAGKSNGTVTGGNDIVQFYQGTSGRLFASIDMVIPKGSSLGIRYNPNLSSGTIKAYCALIGFLKDEESKN